MSNRISISFNDEQYAFLKEISDAKGISVAECVRSYVFEKNEPPAIRSDSREVISKIAELRNDVTKLLLTIPETSDFEIKLRIMALNDTLEDISMHCGSGK